MKKISIIMPVYNSEKYLSKAVESVLNQDFEDYELILVDDGSTDNSTEICDQFAERYDQVRTIHKKNGGICSARNVGLDVAEGEYIGFCDNDDLFLPGLLRDNYSFAVENDVDLMRYCKIRRIEKANGTVRNTYVTLPDISIERNEYYKYYSAILKEDTIWTALYRKKIIDQYGIRFDEHFKYGVEDANFNLHFLLHSNKLGFNSKTYYLWIQREVHSTSRTFHREYLEDMLLNMDLENEFLNNVVSKKIDDVEKNVYFVNSYLHEALEYLNLQTCDLSMKEIEVYLKKMRNHPYFENKIDKFTFKKIKKLNYRVYITLYLFYKERYKSLYWLIKYGTAILEAFRFRKKKEK